MKKQSAFAYVFFCFLTMICIAKIWFGSAASFGHVFYNILTADYWNFSKNLLRGKVLYTDLADHKGLYLYLPSMILQILFGTNASYTVPFVESILFFATASCFYLLARKACCDKEKVPFLLTFFFTICYFAMTMYVPLMNTEGMIAPFLLLTAIYVFANRKVSCKSFFLVGVVIGFFGNMKFPIVSIFFPLFLFIVKEHAKQKRPFKLLALSTLFGVAGAVVVNIPFVVYLLHYNCIEDMKKWFYYSLSQSGNIKWTHLFAALAVGVSLFFCKNEKFSKFLTVVFMILFAIITGKDAVYYNAFFLLLLFMALCFTTKYTFAVFSVVIMLFVGNNLSEYWDWYYSPKSKENTVDFVEFAKEIGTTDANTLYFEEDFGYGVYGEECFEEPLQWVPSGMLNSSEFTEYLITLTKERIKEKRFTFLIVRPEFFEIANTSEVDEIIAALDERGFVEKANDFRFFKEVFPILEEYYEKIEHPNYPFVYKAKE